MKYVSSYDRDAPTPDMGSEWIWGKAKARWFPLGPKEHVTVVEVKWNGEEWWIQTRGPRGVFWNDLSVFWQSVHRPTS